MISLWRRRLEKIAQLMWVRAALFALVGVAAALLAVKLAPFVPANLPAQIGSDAVHQILNILASSMLAVTTFSLSVMVASYSSSTNNVSPRATRLVREDQTTQNVLAVFLGSFLFSLVGIVALNTGYYSDRGRFVLFIFSIGVIGVIVVTMLRWIDHLTRLGRVGETIARVEKATRNAIDVRLKTPFLGGLKLDAEEPSCPRVYVPELTTDELFDDLFSPIARDGANVSEVQIRLMKSLLALAEMGGGTARLAALRHAQQALERSEDAMKLTSEKDILRSIAEDIRTLVRKG